MLHLFSLQAPRQSDIRIFSPARSFRIAVVNILAAFTLAALQQGHCLAQTHHVIEALGTAACHLTSKARSAAAGFVTLDKGKQSQVSKHWAVALCRQMSSVPVVWPVAAQTKVNQALQSVQFNGPLLKIWASLLMAQRQRSLQEACSCGAVVRNLLQGDTERHSAAADGAKACLKGSHLQYRHAKQLLLLSRWLTRSRRGRHSDAGRAPDPAKLLPWPGRLPAAVTAKETWVSSNLACC